MIQLVFSDLVAILEERTKQTIASLRRIDGPRSLGHPSNCEVADVLTGIVGVKAAIEALETHENVVKHIVK